MARDSQPSGWVGWVYFASLLMFVRGFFQIFLGIEALVNSSKVFVVTEKNLAVFNYTAWGWLDIALGVVLITAAASVAAGNWYGRVIGAIMVSVSMLANLAFLPAYPIWSIIALIIDAFILYALVVRGDEARA
jgi:hypothetical protein